ncbi:MAG: SGNH/GDSL hydrolase family protein [Thermoguttaceae bacterium]|jgi:lysophospholipase L1-like esterase
MKHIFAILIATLFFAAHGWGQSLGPALIDMTVVRHKPSEVTTKNNTKAPAGTVDLIDGQFGKACKFSFIESTGPQMFIAWVNPTEDLDQYEGFSFWVKGDGSKTCGGLEFIDADNFALRYGYCFPIESTKWVKVNVAWSDLIPELSGPLVNAKGGFAPNRFRNLWVGKWFYWREWPACSFTIERMVLEKKVPRDTADYRPKQPGTARVLAKLKAKQPITIVTMGDSLSDKRHWANREKLWSEILVKRLKDVYGSEVTLVNPAIGGTTLSQNAILIPRWLQETPSPDLVVIWFGGNDWDTGVRRPRYKQYLRTAIDQLRRLTKGQSDILVMTTCPGFGAWETTAELSQAAYTVAKERNTGFVDAAGAFHKAGSREEALKRQYWAWDNVHLGAGGHDLIADAVFRGLQSNGLAYLKTATDAYWMKASMQEHYRLGLHAVASHGHGEKRQAGIFGP